jgi:arabinogalactan endo-1,4-beta-galactosidase
LRWIVWVPLAAATLTAAVILSIVISRAPADVPRVGLHARGADISFALQEEAVGHTFSDNGTVAPIEQILADNGANYVRLRVWINPPPGYSDEASALRLARRAKNAGLKLFLDLHYSDFWADSKSQTIPGAWRTHDLPNLVTTVREYTRRIIGDFARQGTPVDMVQIGNEVTNGMLWPVGEVYRQTGEDWTSFAALLNAGIDGAREGSDPNHPLCIVIHIDRGGDNNGARHFMDRILAAGVTSFDAIGLSYYPFWHGSLSELQRNLNDLATRYQKDLIIAETAYPWTLEGGDSDLGVADARELPDSADYPPTITGQERYFLALRRVLQQVPDQRGVGLFVWEPEWLPGVGWRPGAGNPWANLTMFDWSGRMLPSLAAALAPPTVPLPR